MSSANQDPVVIVSAKRTPMGAFQGELISKTAPELGSISIKAALESSGLQSSDIDEVVMGCVLPAGLGQAPARQAALGAGLPYSTACTTINKMCGSGMKAIMLAHDQIKTGGMQIAIAGGFESMSNAPYLLPKARQGFRMGHNKVLDHMFLDGLEDAYQPGKLMGYFAERTASHYGFSREHQDDYAIRSLQRAQHTAKTGVFKTEIQPVVVENRRKTQCVEADEQPPKANFDKIRQLKPAFVEDGTVTAANASSISDGAAAVSLMRLSEAEKRGLTPRASVLAHTTVAQAPEWFTTAPVFAIRELLAKINKKVEDIDLYEINEAFAVVAMAAIQELKLDPDQVNVFGGACAMGHPIGASGARIIVTLLNAMEHHDRKLGVASLCIGGGEATAIAIERF